LVQVSGEFPGILNIEKVFKLQESEKLEKERKAAVEIQRWTRGMLARIDRKKRLLKRQRELDEEYAFFDDSVKFGNNYNLQKFLLEKKAHREI